MYQFNNIIVVKQEIKQKYPIGTDLITIHGERFIKSLDKSKDHRRVCDYDVAMAMFTGGRDMINKRPWMVMDKEVKIQNSLNNMSVTKYLS